MGTPFCRNCVKARKACKGYGIQLSWPKNGDNRRAVVCRDTKGLVKVKAPSRRSSIVLLNTSCWDVSLSDALQQKRSLGKKKIFLGQYRIQVQTSQLIGDPSVSFQYTLEVPHLPYLPPEFLTGNDTVLLDYCTYSRVRCGLAPLTDLKQSIMQYRKYCLRSLTNNWANSS